MKVVLPMNGGINKDKNPLYIDSEKGEVLSRKNCRVTSPDGEREGINTSIKGMQEIVGFPIDGTNKTIGFVEDKERDRGVFFVYNSIGNHDIFLVEGTTITPLGADAGVLNFKANEVIDADILGDYCVFVSEYNPPRKIDIGLDGATQKNLTGKDAYDIQLAVRPPSEKPTTVMGSDPNRKVNKLIGKSFQFATSFFYFDNTYSVVSPYSDLVVSSSAFSASDNTYTDNDVDNYVQVTYDLGNSDVKTVRLLAREGNSGSWFVVDEYEKKGVSGSRTYTFYNDVARQGLVETESLSLFSDVPRLARSVKSVQNRVMLGNVLKGYDKVDSNGDSPSVKYDVVYEDVTIGGEPDPIEVTNGTLLPHSYYVEWTVPSSASLGLGDSVNVAINGTYSAGSIGIFYAFDWEYNSNFVVTQSDIDSGDTQLAIVNKFVADIGNRGKDGIVTAEYIAVSEYTVIGTNNGGGVVRIEFVGVWLPSYTIGINELNGSASRSDASAGVSTHKAGSYRNVGVLFYDEYSRTSGVLNSQKVYVPHAGEREYENAFDRARISFDIPSASLGVPNWAKYYRFAITESVNFAGVYPFVVGNDSGDNIKTLFLDGKSVLALNMPTNLQYEFVKGDYLQIELDNGVDAITSTVTKTIIGTRNLITVGSTDYEGFWLIVPIGNEEIVTYDGKLIYIYRARSEVEDLVYFEDSNTYDVVDGEMIMPDADSRYIGGEDAWYAQREFNWDDGNDGISTYTPVVEDFYINVDDAIRAYSKGRVVVEYDTLGEIRLQDVVWSFNYLDNTNVNGISMFNSLNREQMDEKDGEIQRVELVGDVIKVVQDNKETSLYVGKSQISDASGNLQVVLSNDFIGAKNPSADDYGTRYPLSVVVNDRNMFYFDGDKGVIVQSSPNGQVPVSRYGKIATFLRLKDANLNNVFACYDDKNGEYVITFDIDGAPETHHFSVDSNAWNVETDFSNSSNQAPDLHGAVGTQVYSFGFDKVWIHEATSSYNAFFNDLKTLSVISVLNTYPREEKALNALEMDSNRAMNTLITSPVTNTRPVGQKSILYPATYREREGSYTSDVFKNMLGAGGAEMLSLLHNGADMVGKYLQIELTDDGSTECQLSLLTASFEINS